VAFREGRGTIINVREFHFNFAAAAAAVVVVVVAAVIVVKDGPLHCSCGELPNSLPTEV
jgi:hypothetical protein